MSDLIKLLPDSVANQIAAGEVIQRPASAVKELLENAIDAGATEIKLVLKDAGRTLVQVIDNGKGMSATDARLCWERHATSKIKTADDLFEIRSMGFRGEALASIAAISQVEMKTRRETDDLGTHILIEASEVKHQEYIHCSAGTSIAMKNLFFNVPVRRNFLKSNSVEYRHIIEEFSRIALACPHIELSLFHNNREEYHLKPSSLRQRIVALFGADYNEKLVPLDESTTIAKIEGFIGKPEYARKTRGEQYFFVNNRFIKSSYLHHAIQIAYKDLLPQDTFPTYFIYLEIDPQKVDINIHPTKTEIKFEDERSIYAILKSGTQRSLGRFNISPTIDFEQEAAFSMAFPITPNYPVSEPKINIDTTFNPFEPQRSAKVHQLGINLSSKSNLSNWEKLYEGFDRKEQSQTENHSQINKELAELNPSYFQVHNSYIFTQVKGGLILIDQQGAHERILFERFLSMQKYHTGISQQLLFPVILEFNAADAILVEEMMEALHSLGIDIHRQEPNLFVVQGVAPYVQETNIKDLLDGLLEEFRQSNIVADKSVQVARTLARKTSVKKGQSLNHEEMEALVNDLFACEYSSVNTYGKPTFYLMGLSDLAKFFD